MIRCRRPAAGGSTLLVAVGLGLACARDNPSIVPPDPGGGAREPVTASALAVIDGNATATPPVASATSTDPATWAARATASSAGAPPPVVRSPPADTSVIPSPAERARESSDAGNGNKTRPPPTSPDLQERAAHLLDAIVENNPALADDFFFPKAPFIPLKDVADPARYFDQLLATYHHDIKALRAERRDWNGATFVSFELGTAPTWVAPGREYNKIGYWRTFGGKLRYRIGERTKEMTVSTIISWAGRWYVTHLSPIRH